MAEDREQILKKLLARDGKPGLADNPPAPLPGGAGAHNGAAGRRVVLSPDQITSAVHIIAPAQISYIAEVFANDMASALNMRALVPRIRTVAEQSLRTALGAAKKQAAKPKA